MAKGYFFKTEKIKPENQVTAEGYVESVNFAGAKKMSIMFMSKITLNYRVLVRVEGLDKPLTLKACNKLGWGVSIAADIDAADKVLIDFPLAIGDKINVAYDRTKPSKCNKTD